ncbi:hypothetical protein Tco_1255348 [Tanacetum coccineum]
MLLLWMVVNMASMKAAATKNYTVDKAKGYSNNRSQEQSRRQSNNQSSSRNNSYRGQRGGRGNDKYTPLTMTPKEILATEGANFPRPPPMRTPEEQRVGNGYCEYHRQKGHTTNECVQLRQLIDKLVKEGRLDHLVKNIKEGKDKQRSGGKKDAPYMVQSWQRKTKQKVSQKFSHGSGISFPTLTADNAVVEPLTIEINAAGHDIHRMYIDGGASADILSPSPYNGIIGRPGISAIRAVPSTPGMLKFLVDGGIVTIYNTAAPPKECNTVTCDVTQTQRQHATKVTNLKVAIHPDYPEQEVSIGGSLSDTGRAAVCALLQRNLDIFGMGNQNNDCVPRSITETHVENPTRYSPSKAEKTAGKHHSALRTILEEYINSWRQVSCGKSITMTGSPTQLWSKRAMVVGGCAWTSLTLTKHAKDYEENIAFTTSQGSIVIQNAFGLQNRRATYQLLVDNAFGGKLAAPGRVLRKINMKLNPKKCTFGAIEGMFLGYLIEPDGIKPCPEKTKVVIQLPSPRTMKEVQSLNGKLADLNRFLSKSADKSLPLFKTLKKCTKKGDFRWTTEAEEAFKQLKQHIAALPTLVAPRPGEELICITAYAWGN